jgi:hypothetical protein
MKIKTITYIERKNLGNYEYAELSSVAELSEGEDEVTAVEKLIAYVQASLKTETAKTEVKETNIAEQVEPSFSNSVIESPKKEKKSKAKKEKVIEATLESDNTITEKIVEKKKPAIAYDSTIAEHKSIFGGYLAKKYDTSWKTSHPADEIKSFTASLNGKDFLDNDGKIVESFLNLVHGFFGA